MVFVSHLSTNYCTSNPGRSSNRRTSYVSSPCLFRFGLDERVEFKIRDIGDGFDESGVDALFLDAGLTQESSASTVLDAETLSPITTLT